MTIPDSVTRIGESAFFATPLFDNCRDGLVILGKNAYVMKGGCPANVDIPDGIVGISDGAFWRCSELTSVTIPDSVKSIGEEAFYYCHNLTNVTIPDSVTNIEDLRLKVAPK